MPTYYVGPGGNDANAGTSWALRKLTLNGAEDIPVAAGDTVYVGPGTYRETLTVDVSGSAGSPITYIGDYTGANTDGTGGVVRITGSDDDQAAARANVITCGAQRNYRTFRGFAFDATSDSLIHGGATAGTDWIIDKCYFSLGVEAYGVLVTGSAQSRWTISNCFCNAFLGSSWGQLVYFSHLSAVNNASHVIENCVSVGGRYGVATSRVGGVLVRNCTILNTIYGVRVAGALSAGQTVTVNNCLFHCVNLALHAINVGEITENYNNIYGSVTARTNVTAGANSVAYPTLFDTRWFFEAVNGGDMVTPFDLASYSQLINVAGTSPTTTDMRGTSVIGAQREWGALEYDPNLDIEAGSGGGGRPAFGDRTGGKW